VGSTQGLEVRIGGPAEPVVVGGPEAYFARVALESDGTLVLDCLQGELWLDDTVLRNGTVLLDVGYDCEVRARRSVFHDGTEHGLVVESGGIVALEQSEIRSNAGAMLLEGTANIDRSVVRDNYLLGGIDVVGGTLRMTNSMMFANVYQLGAIRATNVSEVDLVYVTVLADSVACEGAGPGMTIRNSAVQYVECAQASIDDSLVTTSALGQGTGNVAFPASDAELEEIFVNPLGGDLHLEDSPPEWLLGIAVRRATDPAIDIDGDPRPRVDQDDYPGADVP